MLEKIEDIKQALENRNYLSALALALTIPDICGKVEYPEFKYKYSTWFNERVSQYYADDTGWTGDDLKAVNPFFTGEMCWHLRCAFLHAGNTDVDPWGEKEDDDFVYTYKLGLSLGGVDSFGSSWTDALSMDTKGTKTKSVRIDVEKLCQSICAAAEKSVEDKGASAFQDHTINILDINNPHN
ncbi:hypothetical protein [Planococcus lenghuensis]|uniref:Uncharacterized protein n=1 Tax=Planococcus lenghuensis TaxID=2213202 RepID=A0A1Q2L3L5_9BACL|nr:hypothetical protein [Planococcus lenghuensis]AQQ55019.1 hypothetical protein B0X71_06075 [Planococcus lenghuensis]